MSTLSPGGTAEDKRHAHFNRPSGTASYFLLLYPALKVLGYFQKSLAGLFNRLLMIVYLSNRVLDGPC
jgi:hypothetical protein